MRIKLPTRLESSRKCELNHVRVERDAAIRERDEARAERDAGRRVIAQQESRNYRLNLAYGIAIDGLAEGHAANLQLTTKLAAVRRERDLAQLLLAAQPKTPSPLPLQIDADQVHDAILHDEPDMDRCG